MAFFCIKRIKGHPYLYWQRNHREGRKVISHCVYHGPVIGAKPRNIGRIDRHDPVHRQEVKQKIAFSKAVSAERLAREIARQKNQDKKALAIRRLRFQLLGLRHIEDLPKLWKNI